MYELFMFVIKFIDVNTLNNRHRTALHFASDHSYIDIVNILISNGADVNIRTNMGETALYLSTWVTYNHPNIMQLLINSGANLSTSNECFGWTPLHFASMNGNYRAVKLLINNGSPIDIQDSQGQTALHHAADAEYCSCSFEIVCLLIKNKSDVSIKDNKGQTALHIALARNNLQVVNLLQTAV